MSDNVSADQLRLLIERAERVMEQIAAAREDLKGVFAEAKSVGFDTKTMKQIIKLRSMTPDARREQEALLDTYKAALGMLDGTPLGNWAVQRLSQPKPPSGETPASEAATPPPAEPETPAPPPSPELTVDDARRLGREAAEAGKAVTTNPFPARDARRAAWDEAWCSALGSDGMDIPDALKPTPKPKPKGEGK